MAHAASVARKRFLVCLIPAALCVLSGLLYDPKVLLWGVPFVCVAGLLVAQKLGILPNQEIYRRIAIVAMTMLALILGGNYLHFL